MYDEPRRDVVPLIIIGIYIGVAATIAFNAYQRDKRFMLSAGHDLEARIFRLENPDLASDAEES